MLRESLDSWLTIKKDIEIEIFKTLWKDSFIGYLLKDSLDRYKIDLEVEIIIAVLNFYRVVNLEILNLLLYDFFKCRKSCFYYIM